VDPSGDNSIVVSPGANARLTPADVRAAADLLASAGVVSLQLEIPLETVAAVAEVVRTAGKNKGPRDVGPRIVLNPSPPATLPAEVLAVCDPLVVNEHEARFLLGDDPAGREEAPEAWAAALLARGPRSVVVTLGAAGALVADRDRTVLVPSLPVKAVDTTGAGDAFTGALAWRLGVGDDLETAVRFAVRVGAAAVTRDGAQESFPTAEEVAAR
jgi:ribokinase